MREGLCLASSLAILTFETRAFAQTTDSNNVSVVTIQATQPIATMTNPGVFTVFRAGDTDATLNVWYDLGGTASNGVDYAAISPHSVAIAAGATSNTIVITPLTNTSSSAAETVVLTLTNSPLLNPVNYEIGSPSQAAVYLEKSGVTNVPPVVSIVVPTNGAVFFVTNNIEASIEMLAKASDPDGSVTNVEFFAGTNDLGPGSPVVLDPPGVNGVTGLVYFIDWRNPSPGNYALTAVATDDGGASTTSAAVNVTIQPGPPPATNMPPVARIVSPPNGAVFYAPVDIPLFAYVNDGPYYQTISVQFFDGTNSIGFGQPVTAVPPPLPPGSVQPPILIVEPTNYWGLVWSNAPVGNHVLTAQATIAGKISTIAFIIVSPPVNITVLPPQPPPTNRPPIVDIVATDPVAIEGTNDWVWPGETNLPATWAAWPTAVCRFFTNCGPKTATFTVRRFGETNDDLTMTYNIGGTASNGVDYVALPGYVTIPAAERRAFITIIPIDTNPPDAVKTVILALTPSTNTPPDYLIGYPPRAAAIIDQGPCRVTGMLPGGCFHLVTPGPDGAWFYVQCSTDLVNWTSICTNQVINGSIDFVDPDAQGTPSRYYRAVPLANPPSE